MNTNRVMRNWYLLLLPAFICSAAAQWTTSLPSTIVGFASALLIVHYVTSFQERWHKWLLLIILPIVALFIAASFSRYAYDLFDRADINNPYLTGTQNFWRAVIQGIGGLVVTLAVVGATRIFTPQAFQEE